MMRPVAVAHQMVKGIKPRGFAAQFFQVEFLLQQKMLQNFRRNGF
jgi:hypothetical protein